MIEGSCLCGGVRYRISGGITGIVDCHCSMCRKAAGGPFASLFLANTAEISWRGEELLTRYESSAGLVRAFCSRCGTAMTGANLVEPDDTFILAANALDGEVRVRVIAEEHLASRARWHDESEGAERYDGAFPGWETLKP
ncbi:MAG: GFA family protein [Candidatus Binatia bacterium]